MQFIKFSLHDLSD